MKLVDNRTNDTLEAPHASGNTVVILIPSHRIAHQKFRMLKVGWKISVLLL